MDDPVHPSMGDLSRIPSVAPSGLSGVGDSSTKQTRKILNPFENFRRTAADKRTENLGERRLLIDIQLCMSAGLAIAIMMSENLVVWYAGSTLIEQGEMVLPANDYDTWVFYFVAGSRALTACLTVYSIIMIAQYYYLLLTFKRQEWGKDLLSGSVAAAPARRRAGSVAAKKYDQEKAAANTFRTTKHATGVKHEYSFIRSTLFWKFLIEVGVHLLFPYPFVSLTLYNFLQMSMFLRLYLVARLLHTNSAAFKKRNRIRSYHEDFRRMNWKIGFKLTMKILFYEHSIAMVLCCTVTTLVLGAFCMFILERNKFDGEDHLFAKYPNCLWFAFVTFTTIGYGDMYPRTASARAVTVVIGVIGQIILAVFGGVVTNKLAPSKQQQLIVSYLKQETGQEGYEEAAACLVQRVWRVRRAEIAKEEGVDVPVYRARQESMLKRFAARHHKRNQIYAAVKRFKNKRSKLVDSQLQAFDPVVDAKLESLTEEMRLQSERISQLMLLVSQIALQRGPAGDADTLNPKRQLSPLYREVLQEADESRSRRRDRSSFATAAAMTGRRLRRGPGTPLGPAARGSWIPSDGSPATPTKSSETPPTPRIWSQPEKVADKLNQDKGSAPGPIEVTRELTVGSDVFVPVGGLIPSALAEKEAPLLIEPGDFTPDVSTVQTEAPSPEVGAAKKAGCEGGEWTPQTLARPFLPIPRDTVLPAGQQSTSFSDPAPSSVGLPPMDAGRVGSSPRRVKLQPRQSGQLSSGGRMLTPSGSTVASAHLLQCSALSTPPTRHVNAAPGIASVASSPRSARGGFTFAYGMQNKPSSPNATLLSEESRGATRLASPNPNPLTSLTPSVRRDQQFMGEL